jgi:L-ascorbate metabolism protein UlaG (beta-lactamase superfamily)
VKIHFLRHATFILTYGSKSLLVDPMLSDKEAMDPVSNAGNDKRIPMVALPVSNHELERLLAQIDGVLVTHTHRDHWDKRAVELLRKDVPILCQPVDEQIYKDAGFTSVSPVVDTLDWNGIHFQHTGGHHGTGEIGEKMGVVSGFVLSAAREPVLYIAGDTVWCSEVEQALADYRPQKVVLNTGAAQFLQGGPITMNADDVVKVCRTLPSSAQVVAVHMETVNHCGLTRAALQSRLEQEGLAWQVKIPLDGAVLNLG